MRTAQLTPGKAVYTAAHSDQEWLRNVQKTLYSRSWEQPSFVFRELWGLFTDPRNIRIALARVASNRGRRSAGVDGLTVRKVLAGKNPELFVVTIRQELRDGTYAPSPVRRVQIPKPGQPGKFRNLGIPTVKDRVIQSMAKQILEPIFEADFAPSSYGFRPGRSVHGALAHLKGLLQPKGKANLSCRKRQAPYQYAIEGDIKACFDRIGHHGLMQRLRRRIADTKVNRLLLRFLKAGVLSEATLLRTEEGVPQGGILSPLLSNIALSVLEERYQKHCWPRTELTSAGRPPTQAPEQALARQKQRGPVQTKQEPTAPANQPTAQPKLMPLPPGRARTPAELKTLAGRRRAALRKQGGVVFHPIRYADDFAILVSVPHGPQEEERAEQAAQEEKAALAEVLKEELGLELSEAKTLVTPVTKPLRFLGHQVVVRPDPRNGKLGSITLIPKDRSQRLREKLKDVFKRNRLRHTLREQLSVINPVLRGWGSFYRHACGAKSVFSDIDNYVWHLIWNWLRKKHGKGGTMKKLVAKYGLKRPGRRSCYWHDGNEQQFRLATLPVKPYRLAWEKRPPYV